MMTVTADLGDLGIVARSFEEGRCASAGLSRPMPYRLLRPEGGPGRSRKYPVVLYLHGAGERGEDNTGQLRYLPEWLSRSPLRETHPCLLIAPQIFGEERWSTMHWSVGHRKWAPEPTAQLRAALAILDRVLADEQADPDRVYLTGLSMGGFGAWEMAARWPERFAAVVPICGGGDRRGVRPLVGLPLWAWHGAADDVVDPERSREMVAALVAAGGHPLYTELPGIGHDAWTAAYLRPDGVLPWLFMQQWGAHREI